MSERIPEVCRTAASILTSEVAAAGVEQCQFLLISKTSKAKCVVVVTTTDHASELLLAFLDKQKEEGVAKIIPDCGYPIDPFGGNRMKYEPPKWFGGVYLLRDEFNELLLEAKNAFGVPLSQVTFGPGWVWISQDAYFDLMRLP